MTLNDLKGQVSEMVIWMLATAIKEGIRGIRREERKETKNDVGIDTAMEIIWKVFQCMGIEVKNTLYSMAKYNPNLNGFCGEQDYHIDLFIKHFKISNGRFPAIRTEQ